MLSRKGCCQVTPLLQFLGQKKLPGTSNVPNHSRCRRYPELYRLALKHDDALNKNPPPLAELETDACSTRGPCSSQYDML